MIKTKNLTLSKIIFSMILLTLFVMVVSFLRNFTLVSSIPSEYNGFDVFSNLWKIIWAITAIIIILYYKKDLKVSPKEMFTTKLNFKVIRISLLVITIIDLIGSLVICKKIEIAENFKFFPQLINCFIIGFSEEIVYRAWGMNAFSKVMSEKKAAVWSSLFFMLVHIVGYVPYLLSGKPFTSDIQLLLAIQLPITVISGIVFGLIFSKTKSIWNCIIIHALMDFIAFAIVPFAA